MRIAFLTCRDLLPDAHNRRADAFEHDLQVAILRENLAAGEALAEIDWRSPIGDFDGFDIALLGTAWDYQDQSAAFLARLDELGARGLVVLNPPVAVRWNIDKIYLEELAAGGAPAMPSLWREDISANDVMEAFDAFGCGRIVAKRRIGAGAIGQFCFTRDEPPPPGWRLGRPGLIQPFFGSIQAEGEYSFVFIGGDFSHALLKRPARNDYRIQSIYGGVEVAITPSPQDISDVRLALDALPFDDLLYARVDMARGGDGRLRVMELELIEPYLYPAQGPGDGRDMGRRMMEAIRSFAR